MKLLKRILILSLVVLLPLSCGCSKQPEGGYTLQDISVTPARLDMVVGDKATIKAYPKPSVANALSLAWKTSDAAVATVSEGLVEAVGVGKAVITVSYQTVSKEIPVTVEAKPEPEPETFSRAVMYDETLSTSNRPEAIQTAGVAAYAEDGLLVNKAGDVVKLDRFYALAERAVRYRIKPSADAVCLFRSSEGDFQATVDIPGKKITILTNPPISATADFLQGDKEYDVEIKHVYQSQTVTVIDVASDAVAEASATMDGEGGCGKGKIHDGFYVGPGWDHYCFGIQRGSSMLVSRITVESLKDHVRLLICGDSITQPEAYYPTADFPGAYTQLLINRLGGSAMSSGRGGGNINTVMEFLPHELPYIKADYVMVTIGTNGGNTAQNLSELIEYIKSQGSIPILNNMPANESASQCDAAFGGNPLISSVREQKNVKGAKLDIATSLNGDGRNVDKSMMYWEDYTDYPAPMTGWQIYHHPNPKGGRAMFERIVQDLPEIFE